MALKTFKPYTKSTRGTVVLDKSNLWKGAPYKPLTKGQNFTGGRNNNGRITSRHIGGGSKHKYRVIDFYRKKKNVPGTAETFIYSRDLITKYILSININTKTLKNKMLEVVTKLLYQDPNSSKRKSHFEISYASVIKIKNEKIDKKELEKIILCDVQKEIYPELEKILVNLIKVSGFPELKLEKKIDFDSLYKQKSN